MNVLSRCHLAKLLVLLTALMGLTSALHAAENRPNIIVILADDFGWGDIASYGGKIPTPHLDAMAREGTRFTQFYVASPICSPSRAGLLTGQFPSRWRITSYLQTRKGNRACEQADFLSTSAPSLPRILKQAGYATAHIGKWHLGGGRDVTNAPPFSAYGYDLGYGTYESPEPHPDITATNWIWSPRDKIKRWDRTRWMVDRTLEFIRTNKGKPCFVNLWLDDTHTPWVPSEDAQNRTPRRDNSQPNLRLVLTEMDRQMGRLLTELRAAGVASNTLVLFLGDNGPLPTFNQDRTAGLRGSKLSLYEGGVRVPLLAWGPGRVPAARTDTESVVSALDFLPTLAELSQSSLPANYTSDGESFASSLLQGKTFGRSKPLFWEYGRNTNSFGFPGLAQNRSPNLAMRDKNWKLLVNTDGTGAQLFDVAKDPKESNDLAAAQSVEVQRLKGQVLSWRKSLP